MCRKVDGADRVIAFPSPFSFFLPLSPNSLSLSQACLHLLLPFSPSLIPSSVICFPFPNSMFLFFLFSNISPLLHCRVSKPLPPLLSRPGPVAPCQRDLTRVSARRSVACNSNKWRAKRVGRSQRDLANVGPFCRGWRTVGYFFGARLYIYKVDEPLLEFVWRKDNEIWGTGEEERIFLNDTREGFRGNFSRRDVCRTITLLDELLLSLKNGYRFIDRDNLCDEDILLLPYINIA